MTIFEKIIAREIPAKIIWEDDDAIAFHDVNPQAPVHVLIVPKKAIPRLAAATEAERAILGKLLLVAGELAKKLGVEQSGYRVVINSGPDAGESACATPSRSFVRQTRSRLAAGISLVLSAVHGSTLNA